MATAAPLVGRAAESKILDSALEEAKGGATRVVTVIGPAGIGKSRLIQDFVMRNRGDSLVPRVYRGSARNGLSSFELFARLLRMRFGLVESMDRESCQAQVRAQVAKVLEDRKVGDVIYFLGQLMGVPFDESPLTKAVGDDPQQLDVLRRAVVKSFLEADASGSPLCLVFEDLHDAHEDSIRLLRYLVEYLAAPVLIVCAARADFLSAQEDWSRIGEARHELIELQALKDDEAASLMEALLAPCAYPENGAMGQVPIQLVDSALSFAGGNPSLLEQMVRIYHDKGVLEEVEELSGGSARWKIHLDRVESAQLPLTIEDAVDARLAALEPTERQLLEHGAAMGSVFWSAGFVALQRMTDDAPDIWSLEESADDKAIADALAELVDRDYILKLPDSTFPGSDEYIFKHNKERETIRKRTSRGDAKRYHAVIADWMDHQETVRSNEEYIAMLADHRQRAGDRVRAGLNYLEAGDAARSRYANAKACEYFEKGLELVGDSYTARRIDALHNYGDSQWLCGRHDDALASFREMLTLAYRLNLTAKGGAAHNRIGRLHRDQGSLDEAAPHLNAAMRLFSAAGDERGVASTMDDIGKLHWLRGEYAQALVTLRDALSRRRRIGDRRSIALSLNNVGLVLVNSGEFKQALETFEQALRIRREIGDLVGVVTTLNNLGCLAEDQREFEKALPIFEEALDVAKQIGDRNRIALVLVNIGEVHYKSGRAEQAIDVLRQAEEQFDELGDRLGLAEALRGLGKAYMLQNDLQKARDCIGRAVDLFASVRSKVHLGSALRTLGEITAAGGWGAVHTKSAREYFIRAVKIFEDTGNEVELARTLKAYSKFLVSDREFSNDQSARDDAVQMNARADEIFGKLKLAT